MITGEYLLNLDRKALEEYIQTKELNITYSRSITDIQLRLLVLQELERVKDTNLKIPKIVNYKRDSSILEELSKMEYKVYKYDTQMLSAIRAWFINTEIVIGKNRQGICMLLSLKNLGFILKDGSFFEYLGQIIIITDSSIHLVYSIDQIEREQIQVLKPSEYVFILLNLQIISFNPGDYILDLNTGLIGRYIGKSPDIQYAYIDYEIDLLKNTVQLSYFSTLSTHCILLKGEEYIKAAWLMDSIPLQLITY